MRRMLSSPARHPRGALAIALLAAALSACSVLRLRPDTSLKSFFPPSDPAAAALDRVFTHFPVAEELLVLVTVPENAPDPNRLLAFAGRLQRRIAADAEGAKLVASVRYRIGAQSRDFVSKVIAPNGLFYLSDAEFDAARHRLTKPEMAEQFRRNEAMLAAPGPAAGALAKALLQDPLRLHEFIETRLAGSRPIATYQNSDAFLSPDGRSLLVRIAGVKPPSDLEFCKILTARISLLAGEANNDGLHLEFSGAYPIAAQSERSIRRDSISSMNGSILCLLLLFIVTFRKPMRLFTVTFAPVALGVLYGFGVYAIFSRSVTPLTAVIGAVLAGIGIDYAIFYLVHYQERRSAGDAPAAAAEETIGRIGGALFAAWVTSVVGFIAIVFASVPALRQFSIVGSLGLAGALAGAVFVLPALLVIVDRRANGGASGPLSPVLRGEGRGEGPDVENSKLEARSSKEIRNFKFEIRNSSFRTPDPSPQPSPLSTGERGPEPGPAASPFRISLQPLLDWIDRRAGACIVVSSIALIAAIAALLIAGPRLGLETDPTVMHPRPNPALDAQAHIAERMGTSPDSLIVYLHADSPEQLLTLAHRVNDRLSSPAAKEAGVASALSLASLLPDPAAAAKRLRQVGPELADRVTRDFDAAVGESSFDPKAYAPYRSFLQLLLTPKSAPGIRELLPYNELAENLLPRTADGEPPTEAIALVFMGRAIDQRAARLAAIESLRSLLRDLPGATLTGMSVLSLDTEATIQRDLPRLTIAAVAIVAVYLLLHFRSIPLALLAVLPTLCSLTFLLAIARLAGAKMNLANIVSIPLLIGIDVDYGIFLVSVTRRSATRAELLERVAASARAVILCASATLLGFGSLAFMSVPAVRSLGWAVAIGVSSCAVSALFFLLPVLLCLKDRSMPKSGGKTAGNIMRAIVIAGFCCLLAGCALPSGRLIFPDVPMDTAADCEWYDIHHTGKREFGVGYDGAGRVDRLLYCDRDGKVNREYRLADYANERVPHLVLLLDSLPFETVRERYEGGDLRWFDPPQKMIAPFPSLTEICYTEILHAPPLPGMVDQYFDPREQKQQPVLLRRAMGYREPWERRLDYNIGIIGQGLSFIHPDDWFAAELEQARLAVERAPTRVSVVYISSAAGMVCAHGRPGAEKVLDGAKRLCLQLLYERRGAIKISMMADHGHNYMPSKNVSVADMLKGAGFHPAHRIEGDKDCVVEFSALVTCGGVHTRHPAEAAAALCAHESIELAIYQQGDRSIIRTERGSAAVECRDGKLRYVPIDADVLGYGPLIERLKAEGVMDAEGFASDDVWFARTLDEAWPDAPRRVWDALHGRFISPPDVILSLKDGYYSGYPGYERFIKMESTHGGLNQINSATFVMTMTGRLHEAVRHEDVIGKLEPGFEPRVHQ